MINFEFQNPWLLVLLLVLPFFIFREIKKIGKKKSSLRLPSLKPFGGSKSTLSTYKPILFLLRIFALTLCIIALARPRYSSITTKVKSDKGVDILLTVDTSLSMISKDLKPNRLSALKEVAKDFVLGRKTDRIGLIEYSGEALTKVPLTLDRDLLVQQIESLYSGQLEDGTAIGIGLATAVNHLKNSKAKSKVIILMTDGVESVNTSNNLLYISPRDAADIAAKKGIKIYTIGIGSNGMAPTPVGYDMLGDYVFDMLPVELDEKLLTDIADKTGGLYFRATNNESLKNIYNEIDKLEKSDINEVKYYNYTELFARFLIPAFILLVLESILRKTIFKELI